MKYCSHCGSQVADEAVICPNCGCKVEGGSSSNGSYSGISIVGFVLAFIMPVIGLIVSIVARNNAKRDGDTKSAGFAKAGIIISACLIAFAVLIYVIVFIGIIMAAAAGAAV